MRLKARPGSSCKYLDVESPCVDGVYTEVGPQEINEELARLEAELEEASAIHTCVWTRRFHRLWSTPECRTDVGDSPGKYCVYCGGRVVLR